MSKLLITFLCHLSFVVQNGNGHEIPLQPGKTVQGIPVHRVPLRYHDPMSPYTLAVSTSTVMESNDKQVTISYNFLATQVWPSARTAAIAIENYMSRVSLSEPMVLCEFGCGPGLPSISVATTRQF